MVPLISTNGPVTNEENSPQYITEPHHVSLSFLCIVCQIFLNLMSDIPVYV